MKKKHGWDKDHWEYHCSDGTHESFWKTVTTSPQWNLWEKEAGRQGFDYIECTGCGWISPEHFAAFLKFSNKLPSTPRGER